MKSPTLPKATWSALGVISVGELSKDFPGYENTFGFFSPTKRDIAVAHDVMPAMQWSTFWHEVTHVALFDAGVNNILSHEQLESICDALGSHLAGMTLAGYLSHVTGKPRSTK